MHQILQSNAPYHNVEHTILVTLTGQAILRGKYLSEKNVSPQDWLYTIIALLCHDIGYVKGICSEDRIEDRIYSTGKNGEIIQLLPETTDASLTPYHVDRGKQFIQEYFKHNPLVNINTIQHYIELTRFPVPNDEEHRGTSDYPGLIRAADLIGQLADPRYIHKMPDLFQEFEETGSNRQFGYHHPDHIRQAYPNFFKNVVAQYIQTGLHYLTFTVEGNQMISHLYQNVEFALNYPEDKPINYCPISHQNSSIA
ncbi:HD domain-containing protein [Planktothrix prolifica]|uniref:HD domain-containing protein n=1 Tax=Planktothrix prolifica TaxID=54307 RepID=UPI000418763A|nr:HD domain-containing protein [Planktothrix prolifica]